MEPRGPFSSIMTAPCLEAGALLVPWYRVWLRSRTIIRDGVFPRSAREGGRDFCWFSLTQRHR